MDQQLAQRFVRSKLTPQGYGPDGEDCYQLDDMSVNPTIITGTDDVGMPIEESIPAAYWRSFVHPCGAINRVVLRTGVVKVDTPQAVAYEQSEMFRMLNKGWLPLWACPYTTKFAGYTPGRATLMTVPEGVTACDGHPDGCRHMQDVRIERTKRARAKHDAEQARVDAMKNDERDKLVAAVTEGMGAAIARHSPEGLKARRQQMAQRDGE